WYHLVCTYNGSVAAIYVNGELNNAVSLVKTLYINTNDITIGKGVDATSYWAGVLDEISVHQQALSATEIRTNYQNELPVIQLLSPVNGSILPSGTQIAFNITDTNGLAYVLYNWNGGTTNVSISSPPYNISLPTANGSHVLRVYVRDNIGLWASATYVFTTQDPINTSTTTPTTVPVTTPTTTTTTVISVPTEFLTAEILFVALVSLMLILWRKQKLRVK
ncbi:MAG: LamG domain-containing protein, partial [Candidatus Hodarchaeota archaeon]